MMLPQPGHLSSFASILSLTLVTHSALSCPAHLQLPLLPLPTGDKFPEPEEVQTGTSLSDGTIGSGQSQVTTSVTAATTPSGPKTSKSASKVRDRLRQKEQDINKVA